MLFLYIPRSSIASRCRGGIYVFQYIICVALSMKSTAETRSCRWKRDGTIPPWWSTPNINARSILNVIQVPCISHVICIGFCSSSYCKTIQLTQKILPARNKLPLFATKTTNKTSKAERKRGSWCGWIDSTVIAKRNAYTVAVCKLATVCSIHYHHGSLRSRTWFACALFSAGIRQCCMPARTASHNRGGLTIMGRLTNKCNHRGCIPCSARFLGDKLYDRKFSGEPSKVEKSPRK